MTGGPGLTVLEVSDPATDTWDTKAPMPTARSDLAAGIIDGRLYVVGGFPGPGTGADLEVYDPISDRWSAKAMMPTPRGDLAAAVLSNKLYAVGGTSLPGQTPLAALEEYTPSTVVSVDENYLSQEPTSFRLYQNYPNPFNSSTTTEFSLPRTRHITLKLYNTSGEEVTTLVSGYFPAGSHEVTWNASGFASGVYFHHLQAPTRSRTLGTKLGQAGDPSLHSGRWFGGMRKLILVKVSDDKPIDRFYPPSVDC